jgi:hypothetical protein
MTTTESPDHPTHLLSTNIFLGQCPRRTPCRGAPRHAMSSYTTLASRIRFSLVCPPPRSAYRASRIPVPIPTCIGDRDQDRLDPIQLVQQFDAEGWFPVSTSRLPVPTPIPFII